MLGWQIALAFFVYAAIGFFLDRTLGTSPWLLLAGILMGLVAVFARIYRVTLETSGKRSPDGKRPPEGTPGETWTADP